MKHKKNMITFTRNDLNHLHDIVIDAVQLNESDEELIERFHALPGDIKELANRVGM